MANMNEPSTGSFPTMGVSAAQLSRVGSPERGRMRPRGTGGKGGSDSFEGPKGNRRQAYGHMGASLHPTTTLYEANAACASDTGRNVVQMPSRASWTDNWRGAARKLQSGVNY
jgi:hypothetical protein